MLTMMILDYVLKNFCTGSTLDSSWPIMFVQNAFLK